MDLVKYHGHLCPELAIGYRVSKIAMAELGITRETSLGFIAGAGNSSSAVDAIQYLTGCTVGKQSFFIEDIGKHVYFFAKKPFSLLGGGTALLIKMKEAIYPQNLSRAMNRVGVPLQDAERLAQCRAAISYAINKILSWPDQRLFDISYADLGTGILRQERRRYN